MTGAEAWAVIAPMIYVPQYSGDRPPQFDTMAEAYVTAYIGLQLYDNWVAHGKPEEWKEKPKR